MSEPTREELAKRMAEARGFGDIINKLRDGTATVGEPDMFGRYPILINGYNTGRAVTRSFLDQVRKMTIDPDEFADVPERNPLSDILWTPEETKELL